MAQKINFDLDGALREGYTEVEIADHLRSKGYDDKDIMGIFVKSGSSSIAEPSFKNVKSGSSTTDTANEIEQRFPSKGIRDMKTPQLEDALASMEDITRTGAAAAAGGAAGIYSGGLAANVAYTGVDEALRAINKRSTGSVISGTQNPGLAFAENVAIGEVGGRIVSKTAKLFKEAVKPGSVVGDQLAKLKPTFSGYFPEGKAKLAKKIEETGVVNWNDAAKARTQELASDEVDRFIQTETGGSGRELHINKAVKRSIPIDAAAGADLDNILNDPIKLQKTLKDGFIELSTGQKISQGNMRQGLASYNLRKMMADSAYIPETGMDPVINGKKLWQEFASSANKGKFDKLYGAGNAKKHEEFFKNIAQATQPDGSLSGSHIDARMKYGAVGLIGSIATGFFTGSIERAVQTAGGLGAIYVLGKGSKLGLSALLNGETSARLMAAMAKGGALGMSQEAAGRILAKEVIGHRAIITNKDGSELEGVFNEQGKLELVP